MKNETMRPFIYFHSSFLATHVPEHMMFMRYIDHPHRIKKPVDKVIDICMCLYKHIYNIYIYIYMYIYNMGVCVCIYLYMSMYVGMYIYKVVHTYMVHHFILLLLNRSAL